MEMEAKGAVLEGTTKIVPPRLEDAGLEDCALSMDSIREAFSKAAQSIKSTVLHTDTVDDEDGDQRDCVHGAGPSNGEWSDELQGNSVPPPHNDVCAGSRVGGLIEDAHDGLVTGLDGEDGLHDDVIDGVSIDDKDCGGSCVRRDGDCGVVVSSPKSRKAGDKDRAPGLVEEYF